MSRQKPSASGAARTAAASTRTAPDRTPVTTTFVEYDQEQLRQVCTASLDDVEVLGLFGSARYRAIVADEHARLDALLGTDPLRLRRYVPRRARRLLYDLLLTRARRRVDPRVAAIDADGFALGAQDVDTAIDLAAVCRRPRGVTG